MFHLLEFFLILWMLLKLFIIYTKVTFSSISSASCFNLIIPGIYSSPTKTLSPTPCPPLPFRLVVAQFSANLKSRPPRCYSCDLDTPMISTPSVYQVFYFRFSTCSPEDDHNDWRRPFRQSYGFNVTEVDIFCGITLVEPTWLSSVATPLRLEKFGRIEFSPWK